MTIKQSTIDRLLKEQKNQCWVCTRSFHQAPYHVHHAVIPKGQTNYQKYKKWLDMPENLILVCRHCHLNHGHLTNREYRDMIWTKKVNMGYDMKEWLESMNMKVTPIFMYIHRPYAEHTEEEKRLIEKYT